MPPNFKADVPLLEAFFAKLPADVRCAFEFRNASWMTDETYRLLEKHRVALCLAESDTFEVPRVITADFVYARLRNDDVLLDGGPVLVATALMAASLFVGPYLTSFVQDALAADHLPRIALQLCTLAMLLFVVRVHQRANQAR